MVAKAATLGLQQVVLDLEDAVVPGAKDDARASLPRALAGLGGVERVGVRINAPASVDGIADLKAIAELERPPELVVVPKVESPEDLEAVTSALVSAGDRLALHALVETAHGLAGLAGIAGAPRCEALVLGYADLSASLGRPPGSESDSELWSAIQDQLVIHARAAGIAAIDGPHLGLDDARAVFAAARTAKRRGFDAKWAIHPAQIAPLEEAFAPTAAEVDWARGVVAALDEAGGTGTARHGGAMVDEAVRKLARNILAEVAS
jgi:citrate lyase subunit beta / citryl-CoA lyase